MYALKRNGSRLYRFIAEHILDISSTTAPVALLAIIALAIFGFACNSSMPTEPIHERKITLAPTPTSTVTPTPTPTPTALPPVTLEEPEDGSYLGCEAPVTLRWSCPYTLQGGECYQLRVKGQIPSSYSLFYLAEDSFTLPALSLGKYNWAVTVVRSTDADEYVKLSEESEWRSFRILPSPIVHSISPTSTVQGTTGLRITVSGEHFTHSLALTIGVPLEATFVNSSTITATVPITLEVGEHPVIVKDSFGQGDSYVSFLVSEPGPSLPSPPSSPWNPTLPVPTALPGYNPNVACVINPCAPAPQLIAPQNGTEFIFNSSIELRWEWAYCLPPGWKFAIQISETSPPHSYRYEDNPKLISCVDGKAVGRYRLPEDSRFRTTPGTYYWNIAVARSVEGGWERLSENSRTCTFVILTPTPSDEGPDRPD